MAEPQVNALTLRYSMAYIIFLSFIILSIAQFSIGLYIPSLPSIAHDLNTTASHAQLCVNLYLLFFGFSQLFYGPLSDRFGRKPILLIGLVIFIIGSLFVVVVPNIHVLLMGCIVQGIGSGCISVLIRAIIRDLYEGKELNRGMSYITMITAISPAIAPIIGGFIGAHAGWIWDFKGLAVYGLIVCAVVYFALPETHQASKIKLNFAKIKNDYRELLNNAHYLAFAAAIIAIYVCQIMYFTVAPFLFQVHLGMSSEAFGFFGLAPAAGYFLGGLIYNRYTARWDNVNFIQYAVFILFAMGALLLFEYEVTGYTSYSIIPPMIVGSIGVGFVLAAGISGALTPFAHIAGVAAAFTGCLQMVGSALVGSVISFFHVTSLQGIALGYIIIAMALMMCVNVLRKPLATVPAVSS